MTELRAHRLRRASTRSGPAPCCPPAGAADAAHRRRAAPGRRARRARGPAAGGHAGHPAPAADARRLHGQPRAPQGVAAGCRRWPASPCCASTRAARRRRAAPARGRFDAAVGERYDVAAAIECAEFADDPPLPHRWLLGWSFGTDLALMHGLDPSDRGRDPALAAAALRHRRAPRRVGGVRQAGAGAGARARRLPAARTRRGGGSRASRRPRWSAWTGPSTCGSASRPCAGCSTRSSSGSRRTPTRCRPSGRCPTEDRWVGGRAPVTCPS